VLQLAAEDELIETNPVRVVKKAKLPKREEVRPLAPATVEAIRTALLDPAPVQVAASSRGSRRRRAHTQPAPGTPKTRLRDATLVALLAYAGLRPGEALRLRWGDVRDRTLMVYAPKTDTHRTVRLLAPLATDLKAWRLVCGRPGDKSLVFPEVDLDNWRAREFARGLEAVGIEDARIYDLRHSFASLLLAEGRNVIDVARQLGHGAQLTLSTYGHVMEELNGSERVDAEAAIEAAIEAARSVPTAHELPMAAV
jgi:integrase